MSQTSKTTLCPDCGGRVSRAAVTCPHCGRQIAPQTVEQTAKRYKRIQVVGFLLVLLAVAIMGPAEFVDSIALRLLAFAIVAIGASSFLIGYGLAWWHHG